MNNTTYISIDVETNGPTPARFSMIALGAAAFNIQGDLIDKFYVNIQELEIATRDEDTMRFWAENKEAYMATTVNPLSPEDAMENFSQWFEKFDNPVFVFYPSKFDGLWVYFYLETFVDRMTFRTTPDMFDTKTLAAALLKVDDVRFASKRDWPKRWKNKKLRHDHVAVNDAIEQGEQFIKILSENLGTGLNKEMTEEVIKNSPN